MSSNEYNAIIFNGFGKPFEEVKYPLPKNLTKYEILVKGSLATVCGSDVHTWLGQRSFPTPSILGHEVVGKIVEMGSEIKNDFTGNKLEEGDRVVWSMTANCGECFFCKTANIPQKCEKLFKYGHMASDQPPHFTGGFAKYVLLPKGSSIFKIPPELSDEEVAPLMCAGACIMNGFDLANLTKCDYVLVQGCGALGMYSCAFAKELGAQKIIAIDPIKERLELAKEFGADYLINPSNQTDDAIIKKVMEITKGRGTDYGIETAGTPEVIRAGFKMLRIGGKYIIFGAIYPGDNVTIDSHDLTTKCLQLFGIHNYSPIHLEKTIRLMQKIKNKFPFKKLVGRTFEFSKEGLEDALKSHKSRNCLRPAIIPK